MVPLSEGRIEDSGSVLQCAYHGWEFDETGGCTRIPQLANDGESTTSKQLLQSPRACATSFPARVEQGLLWIFPTADENLAKLKEPALIAELDDPENVDGTNFFVRDMPYSWDILVENLCDPAHVPFAHHSFMRGADRNIETLQLDLKVTEETEQGFKAEKDPYPTGNGQYDVKFQAPALLYYMVANSKAIGKDIYDTTKRRNFIGIGQYCIPIAPGRSRLIARFPLHIPVKPAMFILRNTPRWITHFGQNIVMDSDVVFLATQDERVSEERNGPPDYYMPARSDAMVRAFRKWLAKAGGKQPKWLGIPAARSFGEPLGWIRPQSVPVRGGRDALLDRYRQHTDVCSSCRRAHKMMYLIREVLTYSGVLLLVAAAAMAEKNKRIALAITSGLMFLAPRVLLRPLIARMECVPWPRKQWLAS
jgi:phenylpropionate dioxygenase-like ring-hydroxylating dioxygenase large terminal subunit